MQLLRNALGLPYHRGRRRATPPPPAPKIELEDIVLRCQVFKTESLYNSVWMATRTLFDAHKVPEQAAHKILRDCIARFDSYAAQPFINLILSELCLKYPISEAERRTIELNTSAYRSNGWLAYCEREASNPEILGMKLASKSERRQAAAAQGNETETETEPEPVNTSDQDESEPETAPEADQDQTEPETTPEPETEDINGLEYSDFMQEIVQSWE